MRVRRRACAYVCVCLFVARAAAQVLPGSHPARRGRAVRSSVGAAERRGRRVRRAVGAAHRRAAPRVSGRRRSVRSDGSVLHRLLNGLSPLGKLSIIARMYTENNGLLSTCGESCKIRLRRGYQRSANRRRRCYNYSWEHGDCWNGPSWPYETSRVLTAAAHALDGGGGDDDADDADVAAGRAAAAAALPIDADDFHAMLLDYARQHLRTSADNASAPFVFENVHPDAGYWNGMREAATVENRPPPSAHTTRRVPSCGLRTTRLACFNKTRYAPHNQYIASRHVLHTTRLSWSFSINHAAHHTPRAAARFVLPFSINAPRNTRRASTRFALSF